MSIQKKILKTMSKERLSLDVGDLKGRVEKCRKDPAWHELSFSGKLRSLILERLEQIDPIQPPTQNSDSAQSESEVLLNEFLDSIELGKFYSDKEISILAFEVGRSVQSLHKIQACYQKGVVNEK